MRQDIAPLLPRLGMLAAALCLSVVVSVIIATPLHSEPGDHISVEEASFSEPLVVERPVAVAKGFRNPGRPSIRPEPAVPPELRNRKPEPPEVDPPPATDPAPKPSPASKKPEKPKKASRLVVEQQVKKPQPKPPRTRQPVRPLPAGVAGRASAAKAPPAPTKSAADRRTARQAPGMGKMALSIRGIGLRNSPIETTDAQRALDRGLIHLPQTSRPWERGKPRNVYVVGHRMGWPGTRSWKIFYRLDELRRGDRLVLTAGGKTYHYRVSEKLVVTPWDVWVTESVKGRDLLTLQTCTGPNFSQRLIVRADRV